MHHNPHKVALVLGTLFGGFHLVWALLVGLGFAQPVMDFILWAHMIHVPYMVGPFDLSASATLVVCTAVGGYVVGYIAGLVWNRIHRA